MTPRAARARSGITLTEILISILILGVGVISLATLFPIGLVRLRNAQRLTRGAFLTDSAAADLGSRNLLARATFLGNPGIAPWYVTGTSGFYNPWVQDTPFYGGDWQLPLTAAKNYAGVNRSTGPGLPVAYDPLWRCVTGTYADAVAASTAGGEARFGQGVFSSGGFLRNDPNPNGGPTAASGWGLQRVTNLMGYVNYAALPTTSPYSYNFPPLYGNNQTPNGTPRITDAQFVANTRTILQTFVSPEDVVFQDPKGTYSDLNNNGQPLIGPSPVVPAIDSSGAAFAFDNDWRFTWFFTGQQSDANSGATFDGEIVVCENRPFALDQVLDPGGNTVWQVAGETVVEAVWNYTATPATGTLPSVGYGSRAGSRSALLRWPASMPDPDVRVGGWIADVTYERNQNTIESGRFPNAVPAQRCYWYQVAKKTEVTPDPGFTGDPVPYRRMTVWTTTPLRAQSLLSFTAGGPAVPVHVEAALVMPSVVNVYPRTIYTR